MSFADCIKRAIDADEADRARGDAATELWREVADEYARFHPRHVAEAMAGEDVKALLRRNFERERHTVLAQMMAERRNRQRIDQARAPTGVPLRVLEYASDSGDQFTTVVGRMNALMRQFNAGIGGFLTEHARDIVGNVRNKAKLKDVLRELHGEGTGDDTARVLADSVRKTMERARVLFNAAGGDIGKLDDFGIPHRHSRQKIMEAGFDEWAAEVDGRLAWSRIENRATGRPFVTGTDGLAARRSFLREIYETIHTDGWNKREVTWGGGQGKSLFRRHSDARVLHFKSAGAWLEYNERFGDTDPFAAITGHLHTMARDIALMEVLGPSHTMGLQNLIDHAAKKVAGDLKAEERLGANAKTAKAMLAHISGAANTPHRERTARLFGTVRQVLSSAHLGSAMLVSGSDSVAMSLAAKSVGMNPANVVSRHMRMLSSSATRSEAAASGVVADTLADAGATAMRFLAETPVSGFSERMNSFVMRAQGLSFWTDMGRASFEMEFAADLARASTPADLNPRVRDTLKARGMTDDELADYLNPEFHFAKGGQRFAMPLYWREAAVEAGMDVGRAERIVGFVDSFMQEMGEIAVPSQSFEMRSMIGGAAEPGSVWGEIARSLLAYKSYAMTFSINQYRQVLATPTGMGRLQYLAAAMAGFTFMGAVGVQLKELAKGHETRPMDSADFWMAAALQGGGLGIVGDLFASSETRLGGGLGGYVAGPVVGFIGDAINLTAGNVAEAVRGDDTNVGRETVNFAKRYTPGTTLWQARAALDRMVWDQLQLLLDPEAEAAMRRQVRRRETEYGNGEWWETGSPLP